MLDEPADDIDVKAIKEVLDDLLMTARSLGT
jgi:hypothetical protein